LHRLPAFLPPEEGVENMIRALTNATLHISAIPVPIDVPRRQKFPDPTQELHAIPGLSTQTRECLVRQLSFEPQIDLIGDSIRKIHEGSIELRIDSI
jgi:hypothetical protein